MTIQNFNKTVVFDGKMLTNGVKCSGLLSKIKNNANVIILIDGDNESLNKQTKGRLSKQGEVVYGAAQSQEKFYHKLAETHDAKEQDFVVISEEMTNVFAAEEAGMQGIAFPGNQNGVSMVQEKLTELKFIPA